MSATDGPVPIEWPRKLYPPQNPCHYRRSHINAAKRREHMLDRYRNDPEKWTTQDR